MVFYLSPSHAETVQNRIVETDPDPKHQHKPWQPSAPARRSLWGQKQRAKDRYAELQLRANLFGVITRSCIDLYNLYGADQEIDTKDLIDLGFDFNVYKEVKMMNGLKVFSYDKHGFYLTKIKKYASQ